MKHKQQLPPLSGVLHINKPENMSSKDVARRLKPFIGKQKIGHVGTLDPFASGVLPLLFGKATKLQDYLLSSEKTYICEILLGSNTDSLDRDGQETKALPFDHVTTKMIEEKSKELVGDQIQEPPMYSAVKFQGKALYKYAREDKADLVPVKKLHRKVHVFSFELLSFDGKVIKFVTKVSKGTYIRVLAQKLVDLLGTAGHVLKLCRSESSFIKLDDCYRLDFLIEALEQGKSFESFLVPVSKVQIDLPKLKVLSQKDYEKLLQGQKILLARDGEVKESFLFLQEGLDFSNSKELLLQNEQGLLFAIGEVLEANNDMFLKVRKGLV